MKVLTLCQPWASLVALGVKTIETRSWSTRYRGTLAIHAGAKRPRFDTMQDAGLIDVLVSAGADPSRVQMWGHYMGEEEDWYWRRIGDQTHPVSEPLPLGAIVATCTLVDVVPTDNVEWVERVLTGSVPWGRAEAGRTVVETDQRPYGDFAPGRYAWLLADVVPVDPPVPFRGGQGLTKTWEPVAA